MPRVPSGVRPAPALGSGETDVGGAAASLPPPAPVRRRRAGRTGIGEQAAAAAVTSGSFRPVPETPFHDAVFDPVPGEAPPPPVSAPPVADEGLLGRVKLVVEQGLIIGEQYLLAEPEMIIGRADRDTQTYPDIDLSGQDNDYVHRVHARLQFHDLNQRLSVEHVGGSNPTLVNNVPAEHGELVELLPGDRLRVGRVVMRLQRL